MRQITPASPPGPPATQKATPPARSSPPPLPAPLPQLSPARAPGHVAGAVPKPSQPAPLGTLLLTYTGQTDKIWGVAWSPDGERLASASQDATVRVWDATGK